MESSKLQRLKSRIVRTPLFSNIGVPMLNASNPRIVQWDAWLGPEDPASLAIAIRQQELHDVLVPPEEEQEWVASLRFVIDHVATLIPYDPDEDVWHAPTAAAWSAAWTFSLEHLHAACGVPLPADTAAQLVWFERGHWPCALVDGASGANLKDYVIF
ncbi:hypothetical protein ACFPTO_18535 [Paraburkholderia denitrificans]|uniref:Uncharacterized protein n=1 Tax=Paraburkholderia denitrificans TaxID=694025 RepID=A0ABW0JCJ3_9BURK